MDFQEYSYAHTPLHGTTITMSVRWTWESRES